jgi:hypothetical protein
MIKKQHYNRIFCVLLVLFLRSWWWPITFYMSCVVGVHRRSLWVLVCVCGAIPFFKDELLKKSYVNKMAPRPTSTLDIQLKYKFKTLRANEQIASLKDTMEYPLEIINTTAPCIEKVTASLATATINGVSSPSMCIFLTFIRSCIFPIPYI